MQYIAKQNSEKKFGAIVSIISNSVLIIIKAIAGLLSGSISVLSEALHSLVDLSASFLAFFSVSKSSIPEDDDHPYGHGKYEDLAGFIEALLIILTAIYILYIAVEKIILHDKTHQIEPISGIVVMFISIVINIIVSAYLHKVAQKTDSIALKSDAEHLRADVFSSLGIIFGLTAVKLTGLSILDPIIAIGTAAIILKSGMKLVKQSSKNLLDGSLPKEDRETIKNILKSYEPHGVIGIKNIKTSKSGPRKLVQIVILLPSGMTLIEVHNICDSIEKDILQKLKNCAIIIHTEPCCDGIRGGYINKSK